MSRQTNEKQPKRSKRQEEILAWVMEQYGFANLSEAIAEAKRNDILNYHLREAGIKFHRGR